MKDIVFKNIEIVISASSAEEAYSILCEKLKGDNIEYTTDTFIDEGDELDTSLLFPKEKQQLSVIKKEKCSGHCDGKNDATEEMHPCPYAQDMNNIFSPCNCCAECERGCAMDV